MCFRPIRASVSRRRRPQRRQAPLLPHLAVLDLSKPGERLAHDFLLRATTGRDRMWELIMLRRRAGVLLCVVQWVHPGNDAEVFSLAEVSLTEIAVHWRYFKDQQSVRGALEQRLAED